MRLVVGEDARRQRAPKHRARVEVRPKGPLIRPGGANRRVPVHDTLPEVIVAAQERLAHPQPNMPARDRARTTRPETPPDTETGGILINCPQDPRPAPAPARH